MASSHPQLAGLMSRLAELGIPSKFARKVLPDWWDDEIASEPAGLQEAQQYFSRAFNLELKSLCGKNSVPKFRESVCKFKLQKNLRQEEVFASSNFATGMARLALQAVQTPQLKIPQDPADLRKAILNTNQCVSLIGLLTWCSSAHIPVIHVESLPGKKMTGLVVREKGRYAIVLSKRGHPAYMLFYLAHELGHIARNHLAADGVVVDEVINGKDGGDADEKEADAYAIRLINGGEIAFRASQALRSAATLHRAAVQKGKENQIDPGHIILNFGFNQSQFPLANAALKLLGDSQGSDVINSLFFSSIQEDCLSEDQLKLLRVATGASLPASK